MTITSRPAINQADYKPSDNLGYVCEYPVAVSDFVVGGAPNEDGKVRREYTRSDWCYHAARYVIRSGRGSVSSRSVNWLCPRHYGGARGPDDYNK